MDVGGGSPVRGSDSDAMASSGGFIMWPFTFGTRRDISDAMSERLGPAVLDGGGYLSGGSGLNHAFGVVDPADAEGNELCPALFGTKGIRVAVPLTTPYPRSRSGKRRW